MNVMQKTFFFLFLFSGLLIASDDNKPTSENILEWSMQRPASPSMDPELYCTQYIQHIEELLPPDQKPQVQLNLGANFLKLFAYAMNPIKSSKEIAETVNKWKDALKNCFTQLYGKDGKADVVNFKIDYNGRTAIPLISAMLEPICINGEMQRCTLNELIRENRINWVVEE